MRLAAPAALLVAAGLAGLAGCATSRPAFRCEARGGPPWHVLYADHFVLVTDLEGADARALAGELEVLREAVASSLFQHRHEPPVRVAVVAFADRATFQAFAPAAAVGYYAQGESDPKIVLPGTLGVEQRRVLAHEMAHHVASYVLLRQPRWLSEGLATWAETLGAAEGGADMVVGAVPRGRRPQARPKRIPARDLLAWDDAVPPDRLGAYYDAAWLLVHYLSAQHAEALREYERRLNGAEDPVQAFREVFPQWDPARPGGYDALDRDLDQWARMGRFEARPVHADGAVRFTERPLPPAEVHALRLLLWPGGAIQEGDEVAWHAEAGEALAEDPAHPVVLRLLAARDRRDPLPLARASAAGHPADARAWSFLAEALPPGATGEREAALRRAAELSPDTASTQAALARELLSQGRSGEALPAARRAVQLAPFSSTLLDVYGAVAADLGQCGQAVLAARRALDVLPDAAPAPERERLRLRLATYEAHCGSAAP